jgi:hypothetical protein
MPGNRVATPVIGLLLQSGESAGAKKSAWFEIGAASARKKGGWADIQSSEGREATEAVPSPSPRDHRGVGQAGLSNSVV